MNNLFGWTNAQVRQMTIEEYCARGLGKFLDAATRQMDYGCHVLDYENLRVSSISEVFRLFGIGMPDVNSSNFQQTLRTYSKGPERDREFESDCERKQREAPSSVRDLALKWAQRPYETLRQRTPHAVNII
jgi:hypothetical protein